MDRLITYRVISRGSERGTASLRSAVRQALKWRSFDPTTRITDSTGREIDIDEAAAAEGLDSKKIADEVFRTINRAAEAWSRM